MPEYEGKNAAKLCFLLLLLSLRHIHKRSENVGGSAGHADAISKGLIQGALTDESELGQAFLNTSVISANAAEEGLTPGQPSRYEHDSLRFQLNERDPGYSRFPWK